MYMFLLTATTQQCTDFVRLEEQGGMGEQGVVWARSSERRPPPFLRKEMRLEEALFCAL